MTSLTKKEIRRAPATAARYRGVVNAFQLYLEQIADRPLAAVQVRHVEDYITRCLAATSASNARLHLATVRTAFSGARRQSLIDTNPAEAVEMPEVAGEGHGWGDALLHVAAQKRTPK